MNPFENLPSILDKSLKSLKLDKPTEVQKQAVPEAIKGRDVIVSAPTGTGKTLAFSVPILAKLLTDNKAQAIIITPTREIALQINQVIDSLLKSSGAVKSALLIGGTPMPKQLIKLKKNPQLIIGTPGRINDHLKRKTLNLSKTDLVVLDEIDRMLDMGFTVQIDEAFKFLPEKKQILMFSATIPKQVYKTAEKYLNDPAKVVIEPQAIVNTDIKQDFNHTKKDMKYHDLLNELANRDGTIIIFSKTKRSTEELAKKLVKDGHKARAIHGDLRQHQREKIVRLFRKEEFNIVVATDVAARGIDIPHIKHVINYNLPTNPEDYVHRVGRTGRAGSKGFAISFVSPDENKEWIALEHFLDPSKPKPRPGGSNSRSGRGARGRNSNKPGNRRKKFGAKKGNNPKKPNSRKPKKFGKKKPLKEKSKA